MAGGIEVLITVAFMTSAGAPYVAKFDEKVRFMTQDECRQWEARMTPRIQDYVRGAAGLDWDAPVLVVVECLGRGDPA